MKLWPKLKIFFKTAVITELCALGIDKAMHINAYALGLIIAIIIAFIWMDQEETEYNKFLNINKQS